MIVHVHSLGSLWQQKDLPNGGTRLWNTTGVHDGNRVRSYATLFGQLQFGPKTRGFFRDIEAIAGASWVTGNLCQTDQARKLRLCCRAPKAAKPDWFLIVMTQKLVGVVGPTQIDPENAIVLSASQRKDRQELLILARPFAWISGPVASAILLADGHNCHWSITRW
jgi:hypothetical protein